MKVFLTGGNGFIGSRVAQKLLDDGHTIRFLLRESSRTERIEGIADDRHVGDILDFEGLLKGVRDCDAVIHLASVSSWNDLRSNALEHTVIEGSRNVFEACVQAGNLRCVFISSASAVNASKRPAIFDENSQFELEGTPLRYAIAKNRAEGLASDYVERGLSITIVNPVEVYGPNDTDLITACNMRDIMKNYPALACSGGTAIAHVDDVADGIVQALHKGRPGERYILGGENLTIRELVRMTLSIAGLKKPIVKIPNALLRWSINMMARIGLPTPVIPEVLDYATRYIFMDCSKAMRELDYRPRSAVDVLRPVVEWLREAGHV